MGRGGSRHRSPQASQTKEDTIRKKRVRVNAQGIYSLSMVCLSSTRSLNICGENVYTGVAGKGKVRARLEDHLPGHKDAVPEAARVQIDQQSSIHEAEKKESGIISHSKPKYNQRGK